MDTSSSSILSSNKDTLYNCQLNILDEDEKITKLKKFISIMYFLGFYSAPSNLKAKTNFWSYTWGYFVTILLFSIRAYFLSKFTEIRVMYMNDSDNLDEKKRNNLQSFSIYSRQSKLLEIYDAKKVRRFGEMSDNVSVDTEINNSLKTLREIVNDNNGKDEEAP